MKEIEYFFEKRHLRRETWHKRYFAMLTAVFSFNLLARWFERRLNSQITHLPEQYSAYAHATMLALREFNQNRKQFAVQVDKFIMLPELIYAVNKRVNDYCSANKGKYQIHGLIHASTPMGVEIEFSNRGKTAGKLLESRKNDAMLNFSKYHYYHLPKFMWRLGAYVDADMPFKQFIRRGGFLEYTFTRPDSPYRPSQPLTTSPALAASLIEESIRFTPIRPHSLHVTFQTGKQHKLIKPAFDDIINIFLCTGHFVDGCETRLLEKNMKEWALPRHRRNDAGLVTTLEYTHMRACRDFIRRGVYEPAILTLLACKNIFNFDSIGIYSKRLADWAGRPCRSAESTEGFFALINEGLRREAALPEWYIAEALTNIRSLYQHNLNLIDDGVSFGG